MVEQYPRHRIYEDLRARIESGRWDHYAALPTSRELAEFYGTSHVTCWKALERLRREGLLYGLSDFRPWGGAGRRAYRRAGPTEDCSEACKARWH
jgi:DNA-binding transcriptional MocR family regulator